MITNDQIKAHLTTSAEERKSPEVVELLRDCDEIRELNLGFGKLYCPSCHAIVVNEMGDCLICGNEHLVRLHIPSTDQLLDILGALGWRIDFHVANINWVILEDIKERVQEAIEPRPFGDVTYYQALIIATELALRYNQTGVWGEYKDGKFE